MKKTPKKKSLLEEAKNLEPRIRCWTDGVDSDLLKELEALRRSYQRGQLDNVSLTGLHKLVKGRGIKVGVSTFRDWMKRTNK